MKESFEKLFQYFMMLILFPIGWAIAALIIWYLLLGTFTNEMAEIGPVTFAIVGAIIGFVVSLYNILTGQTGDKDFRG